jgi:hypothetical protein
MPSLPHPTQASTWMQFSYCYLADLTKKRCAEHVAQIGVKYPKVQTDFWYRNLESNHLMNQGTGRMILNWNLRNSFWELHQLWIMQPSVSDMSCFENSCSITKDFINPSAVHKKQSKRERENITVSPVIHTAINIYFFTFCILFYSCQSRDSSVGIA